MAEVLITLGIIGIVCALTLPSLVSEHREKQTVVKLKHTYNLLDQAVKMMIVENGELDQWGDDSRAFFQQELVRQLRIAKECKVNSDCSGFNWQNTPTYVLNNGVAMHVTLKSPNINNSTNGFYCSGKLVNVLAGKGSYNNKCAQIQVDLNGKGRPNKSGYDIFEFIVYTDGIIPAGAVTFPGASWIDTFDSACWPGKLNNTDNRTCTAWVIYHENMDYLKCRDQLSWDGPYSCSKI